MISPTTLVCHKPARRRLAAAGTAEVVTSPFGSTRAQCVAAADRRARGRWGSAQAGRGRSTHCAEVHVVGGRLEQRDAAVTPRVGELAAPPYFAGGSVRACSARGTAPKGPPHRASAATLHEEAGRPSGVARSRITADMRWLRTSGRATWSWCSGRQAAPSAPRWTAPVPRVRDGARRYATLCRLCCRALRAGSAHARVGREPARVDCAVSGTSIIAPRTWRALEIDAVASSGVIAGYRGQ